MPVKKIKSERNEKKLLEEIEIPEAVEAKYENDILYLKKNDKKLERKIHPLINIKIDRNKIIISARRNRRMERKMFGTTIAHVKNMINGFLENFKYRLQIVNVHFPMSVSFDKDKNELIVKNFLGEKKERRIKLIENVNVKITKDIIELDSFDIEKAGLVAAKIENGTKVRNKDRRVYQDGIYLIEKPGRSYL